MKTVIIINGAPGSGKDKFIEFFTEHSTRPVINFSSIDIVKQASRVLGWNGEKTAVSRDFLHELKSLSDLYFDTSFKSMVEIYKNAPENSIMFFHIREPDKIKRAVNKFYADTLLIRRENKNISYCSADLNVEDYDYDDIIINDGNLKDLERKANEFILLTE